MWECRYDEPMRSSAPLVAVAAVVAFAAGFVSAWWGRPSAPPPLPPPPQPTLIPPLHDAQVGEWIRLEAGVDAEVYRVVGATDYEVQVEVTSYHNGEPSPPIQKTWHRNGFGLPPNCVVREIDPEVLEVGGTKYDCWRLSIFSREPGKAQLLYWICDKIPVHGLLEAAVVQKGAADETHAARLVDWGPRPAEAGPK